MAASRYSVRAVSACPSPSLCEHESGHSIHARRPRIPGPLHDAEWPRSHVISDGEINVNVLGPATGFHKGLRTLGYALSRPLS
jgi:hypothetical protein